MPIQYLFKYILEERCYLEIKILLNYYHIIVYNVYMSFYKSYLYPT